MNSLPTSRKSEKSSGRNTSSLIRRRIRSRMAPTARFGWRWSTTSTSRAPEKDILLPRTSMLVKSVLGLALMAAATVVVLPLPRQEPARLEVHVVQVPLLTTVTDGKGKFITTLNRENFRIFEDGRAQKIDSFARETSRPLTI